MLHQSAFDVARRLKTAVRDELSLTVSIGIGPCKFIAKIASELGKPDGLVLVHEKDVSSFLAPLPPSRIWGVGKVAGAQLEGMGIRTIGELAELPKALLTARFGTHGERLWQLAHGIDDRPVIADRIPKSIGQEDTFEKDLMTMDQLKPVVCQQADRVAQRLRRKGYWAQTVVLKVKTADFKIQTRRRKLDHPTRDGMAFGKVVCGLLESLLPTLGPIRLTGVSVTGLITDTASRQLSLDEDSYERQERLVETRFGAGTIVRGDVSARRIGDKSDRPR
jgi:DNA polymerase-4